VQHDQTLQSYVAVHGSRQGRRRRQIRNPGQKHDFDFGGLRYGSWVVARSRFHKPNQSLRKKKKSCQSKARGASYFFFGGDAV
jgi:hypothetical protein